MDRQSPPNSPTSRCLVSRRRARLLSFIGAAALAASALLDPTLAWAGPREDMKTAYSAALMQINNLEYDAAAATLNNAINGAESAGAASDPVLASLYMLRAALTFSAQGHGAAAQILQDLQRAVTLNYYVVVPIEMRSNDLTAYMTQARQAAGVATPEPITLRDLEPACGADLQFEVLLSVPDGGTAALYWRKQGSTSEFVGVEMPAFSNVAEAKIPASEHGDASIEYFVYAFDASMNPAANLGLQDSPLVLEQNCTAEEPGEEEPVVEPEPQPSSLPRVWINLGVGTGFGIASGTAENTYRQFFPAGTQDYGAAEAGCAIARWVAGTRNVADVPGPELSAAFDTFGGGVAAGDAMRETYNAAECSERHPVSTGFAIAPLHVAPEISFRIGKRVSLGVVSRLQVVTGAKVFRDDPNKDLTTSYNEDILNPSPTGVKQKIKFSWSVGLKFKYFLGKESKKFRPFVGAFAGYGNARLRVNMGFANDRNGNSVPDDLEVGSDTVTMIDPATGMTKRTTLGGTCQPVWPYLNACDPADASDPMGDTARAANVAMTVDGSDRIDVVRIGPGFVGALVGFNYQIVKNFALFGELNIGGWFPSQSSMLIDLTVGPAITF